MARHVVRQAGAPSSVPPSVGAHYIDASTGNLYLAKDVSAISDWVLLATGGTYTDEQAQDAVGTILTDSTSVDFTYNDAGNQITASVLPTGVNHNALQNYVTNQHVDHTTVSITAGTGLSGGGDISTSRTLGLANTTVTAGTYGSPSFSPTLTVDAQGRLTAASATAIQISESQVTNLVTDLSGKASTLTTITAGTGLSGGGDLSTNRTLSLANTTVTPGTYGSVSSIPVIAVDAQGRVTTATSTSVQITESQVTNLVTDLGAKANTTTTITAGTGLSGGGDLSTSRTLSLANTAVTPNTYGSSTSNVVLAIDAQGRITSASTATQDVSTVTGTLPIANGGTGQTSQTAAFDALSPLSTTGDLLTHNGADNVRLPAGSSGQVLTMSGATPAWSTPSGSPGPESLVQLYDDFVSATTSSTNALGWLTTTSGGSITSVATPEVNTVGVLNLATSTLITGRAAYSSTSTLLYFSAVPVDFVAYVRIPALSTAAQRFAVYVGLGDQPAAGDMIDGAYFQYTDANSAGNWELKTANNSVRTTVNSTVPATTGWTRLSLSANAAGTNITFSINGTTVGTITTNIPTTAARATGMILKIESSAGTTSKSLYVDYVKLTSVVSR